MRIVIDPVRPSPRAVKRVSEIISSGGIVVYPTDTVYGIGCCLSNKKGADRINAIKKSNKPRSIMLSDLKNISMYALVSNKAFKVIKNILPGPYTVILPATRLVPRLLQSKRKTIGIRMPDHWFCKALVTELGEPLFTGSIPTQAGGFHVDPLQIEKDFGHMVDAIVDCGILADIPSTIISMETDEFQILREGLGSLSIV
jgi:tRNA threonylcarbamoyl adenosine modification protein (Sua5/YciO/YrdC/YwlC family)